MEDSNCRVRVVHAHWNKDAGRRLCGLQPSFAPRWPLLRYAAATRLNRFDARDRPTSDVAPCSPLRSLVDAAGVDKSTDPTANDPPRRRLL